jgi:hypothetical protein
VGFFAKDDTESTTGLAPLTPERIEAVLKKEGYYYFIDSDGDIGGHWGDHTFYFLRFGEDKEMLQVRGRWHRKIDPAWVAELSAAANEWNTAKLFPKAYVRVTDNAIEVYGEHTVDYEHGVTDKQLLLQIDCGVQTTLSFFATLDEKFPQVAVSEN